MKYTGAWDVCFIAKHRIVGWADFFSVILIRDVSRGRRDIRAQVLLGLLTGGGEAEVAEGWAECDLRTSCCLLPSRPLSSL